VPEPAHGSIFTDMCLRSQPVAATHSCYWCWEKADVHSRGTATLPTFNISTGGTVFQKQLLPFLRHQGTN